MIGRYISRISALIAISAVMSFGFAAPAYAANCASGGTAEDQVLHGIGQTGSDCDDSGVESAISGIVKVLSYVVGVAAIIVLVIAGLKYVTSAGDSGKIASAKSTFIYALVGLAIAALAQFFVNFVLANVAE